MKKILRLATLNSTTLTAGAQDDNLRLDIVRKLSNLKCQISNVKGFTLVELMVTVSVVAILSLIGLVIFAETQKRGRDVKRRGELLAIVNYFEGTRSSGGIYQALNSSGFVNSTIPLTDPQTKAYCGNSTVNTLSGDPTTSTGWTSAVCPTNYTPISTSLPVPATGATSWKVCTWLEADNKAFCKTNVQ